MWQRFTERARKVVFYAQEEAQKFGEGYVSTEHLLLGLVRESDSVAAQVLEAIGVSLNRIRIEVEKQVPRGDARPSSDMTLTPRAKRVIDLSYEEARGLGNNYIGTEHLLLGLLRERDGLAGRVLQKLGLEVEIVRPNVMRIQEAADQKRDTRADPAKPKQEPEPRAYAWDEYDETTKRAILLADEMAKAEGALQVTPYYLLKALLTFENSAALQALANLNIDPAKLDAALEENQVWAHGAPPIQLSPYARKIIDRTTVEADSLGQETVGSDSLLLGMVFGNSDGIGRIVRECGAHPLQLRDMIKEMLEERKRGE